MQKRVLIITGSPGVGKTTALTRTIDILKEQGHSVGGMLSREVRECGVRVGFEIVDVGSSSRGWLAQVNLQGGPQVGKYRVNVADLNGVGVQAITQALDTCEVVVIDEIGLMELFSEKFKEDAETVVVTVENREKLPDLLAEKANAFLKAIH